MSVEDHLGKECRERRIEGQYLGVWHRVRLTKETEGVVRGEGTKPGICNSTEAKRINPSRRRRG